MKIFMQMSWRNIWRHGRRSLVVISTGGERRLLPQNGAFLTMTSLTDTQCKGEVEFRYPGKLRDDQGSIVEGTISRTMRFSLPRYPVKSL